MQIENMRSQLQLIFVTIFPFAFSCAVVHFEWESVSVQSPHCANYFTINCRFFILIETGIGKPLYSASRTWHLNWWKMIGRKSTFHSVSQTQCDLLYLLWASDVRTYNDFKRRVWKAEGERDTKHTHTNWFIKSQYTKDHECQSSLAMYTHINEKKYFFYTRNLNLSVRTTNHLRKKWNAQSVIGDALWNETLLFSQSIHLGI